MEQLHLSDKDIAITLPARILVAGMSGSGKSTWILKLLKHRARVLSEPLSAVYYCFPEHSTSPKDEQFRSELRKAVPNINFVIGVPDFARIAFLPAAKLVILDDLISSLLDDEKLFNVVTTVSRHSDVSLIITTQNLYLGGKYSVSLVRNCSEKVFFYDKADRRWLATFSRQMLPQYPNFLPNCMSWLQHNEKNSYDRYLVVDNNPKSTLPESMLVRTRIFPLEDGSGSIEPIYFSPVSK